jgi:hypothetical protein
VMEVDIAVNDIHLPELDIGDEVPLVAPARVE